MAIKTKRPPMKETVGAQYLCFNTMDTDIHICGRGGEDRSS